MSERPAGPYTVKNRSPVLDPQYCHESAQQTEGFRAIESRDDRCKGHGNGLGTGSARGNYGYVADEFALTKLFDTG